MNLPDFDLCKIISYLISEERTGLEIEDRFQNSSNVPERINAAFLLSLSVSTKELQSKALQYLHSSLASNEASGLAEFYLEALARLQAEFSDHRQKNPEFNQNILTAVEAIKADTSPSNIQEKLWQLFFPSAVNIIGDESRAISDLRDKRKVTNIKKNPDPISKPGSEILFTSNILLSIPLNMDDLSQLELGPEILQHLKTNRTEKQKFWYDHPIPLGISPDKNEVLYGIHGLDQAVEFERARNNLMPDEKVTCVLSASVTHDSLHKIAKQYIENEFKHHGKLKNLDVYVFTESETDKIISDILIPAAKHYLDLELEESDFAMFGVDGEYGRHYSFLKAVSAYWQVLIDPEKKATFKIDLDQVFPQDNLVEESGYSAFEHFISDLWGAAGTDNNGRDVTLGMIAGALVNEKDISKSLFTPDIPIPKEPLQPPEQVFYSKLPQAISTQAEMMTRYDSADLDGRHSCLQRVHVTGGTNGILINSLRKFMPFTPSFFGRAEDQAYIMSAINDESMKMAYLHKPGLIMRHDKESFAGEVIAANKVGKMIGDYIRIIYFSAYARLLDPQLNRIKEFLDPFTGGFISYIPMTVVYLRLALQVADLFQNKDKDTAVNFITDGTRRISDAVHFAKDSDKGMTAVYETELSGWKYYYQILSAIEDGLENGDDFAQELKSRASSICEKCQLKNRN